MKRKTIPIPSITYYKSGASKFVNRRAIMSFRAKIFGHSQAKWFSNYLPEFDRPASDISVHAFPGYRIDEMWSAIKGDVTGCDVSH